MNQKIKTNKNVKFGFSQFCEKLNHLKNKLKNGGAELRGTRNGVRRVYRTIQ